MTKKNELNTLYHCTFKLQYHLVIVTKYRKNVISPQIMERLGSIFRGLLDQWDGELLEFNGESDHIHLLISLNPKTQPSKLVNNLKTVSSRRIRKEFNEHVKKYLWKDAFWSRSYCIISVGGAPISVLRQYIEQQGQN
jgi:putative transposase